MKTTVKKAKKKTTKKMKSKKEANVNEMVVAIAKTLKKILKPNTKSTK